ncbi:TIGR03088 family PEP-CTERM/XrtA system glycosyltransferase [Roseateles saccharophilus]|uniref:Sugar transferase (PEP-CTERM/EpsH1 system associated) n=1 Tax=Roseateles saccharophilus TaxID=304 RepID=A0A4R3UI09_ROSSA|nr:TIGR03088 family PEP-CTERM/XrtA system glycosyltransferase [Roseateles saccharophilus]MDG0835190.1 TIGR03088 family PEP-CTERM/XrtA system glycosyltransferase [Roseateles saccharophilus]TCU87831.1 sugar transferase (PEP-CTERM/EpsH1 system associated) [Roseateles saccharophilus]
MLNEVAAFHRPLVVHLLHRFDTGGLENGVVNIINHLPAFRHAVVAVTEITAFKERVKAPGTQFISLHKSPGQGLWLYPRVYRLLRELRPAVVHTRNLGAMEFQLPAWAARVPLRVHSEHGWDTNDLGGVSRANQRLRRVYGAGTHRFVALSKAIESYLTGPVGFARERVLRICNGVDTRCFAPSEVPPADWPFRRGEHLVVGAVGRMQAVKDPLNLVDAFLRLRELCPADWPRLRLVMLGGGPLLEAALERLAQAGAAEQAWLPGDRGDVARLLSQFDIFALPSQAEGISNTLLEAMACGCAPVATDVGGNPELVEEGVNGLLVPARDSKEMAIALARLVTDPVLRQRMGAASLARVRGQFSLDGMVAAYGRLYAGALPRSGG